MFFRVGPHAVTNPKQSFISCLMQDRPKEPLVVAGASLHLELATMCILWKLKYSTYMNTGYKCVKLLDVNSVQYRKVIFTTCNCIFLSSVACSTGRNWPLEVHAVNHNTSPQYRIAEDRKKSIFWMIFKIMFWGFLNTLVHVIPQYCPSLVSTKLALGWLFAQVMRKERKQTNKQKKHCHHVSHWQSGIYYLSYDAKPQPEYWVIHWLSITTTKCSNGGSDS